MQSFHHSRGKVLFEIFCALAVSASCVGAWMQTGAWALLGVASVAALYGFSHAFDLKAYRTATPVDLANAEPTKLSQDGVRSDEDADVPLTSTDRHSTSEEAIEKANPVERAMGSPKTKGRRPKARQKSGDRGTKGAKVAKATEVAPRAEAEIGTTVTIAEEIHSPPVPLFEPQPFMRHTRVTFGRKDNLA